MSVRGLLTGMVIGVGLVAGPALGLYVRVLWSRPSTVAYNHRPAEKEIAAPGEAPSPAVSRPTDTLHTRSGTGPADVSTAVNETSEQAAPGTPAGPFVDSPAQAILASLTSVGADGFPPPRSGVLAEADLQRILALAQEQVEKGDLVGAHDLLSRSYFAFELTKEQRELFEQLLEPLADRLLRSREILEYGPVHVVQPGDTPAMIARPFKVPHEFLARLNGYSRYIRVGQRLKLVRGPFDVLVELSQFELVVLLHGRFIKRYPIGIGKNNSSPTGLFRVVQKVVNPTWYPAEGGVYPPDDPRNPLGTRWIGIGGSYGIHGTREPDSIGRPSSRGCIRMRNEDVEEVYDMVVEEHSRVLIRP